MMSALDFVWSLINNLQVVTHLFLLKSKSPANANEFNSFFLEAANFDIIEIEIVQ